MTLRLPRVGNGVGTVGDGLPSPDSPGAAAVVGNLDTKTVEAARKPARPYRPSDGDDWLLEVRPSRARMGLVCLTVDGKRRDTGLGGYPGCASGEAREAAATAPNIATGGGDPVAERERLEREQAAQRKAPPRRRREVLALMLP